MRSLLAALLAVGFLTGCATPSSPPPAAVLSVEASSSCALEAAAEALMASGYVVRYADASLGRLEAVFSRWPGYRVRVKEEGAGSRLALTATRGGSALPPATLERLAADIVTLQVASDGGSRTQESRDSSGCRSSPSTMASTRSRMVARASRL